MKINEVVNLREFTGKGVLGTVGSAFKQAATGFMGAMGDSQSAQTYNTAMRAASAPKAAAPAPAPAAPAPAPGPKTPTNYAQVKASIDTLDKKGKQRILQLLQKSLGVPPAAAPAAKPAAAPAAPAPAAPAAPTKITLPGTNMSFTKTTQWVGPQGQVAGTYSSKVLDQLANGVNPADIPMSDILSLRQEVGISEDKEKFKW